MDVPPGGSSTSRVSRAHRAFCYDVGLMKRCLIAAAAYAAFFAATLPALDNGLARTPPMGWNSWNKFACEATAEAVLSVAQAMVRNGMKDEIGRAHV